MPLARLVERSGGNSEWMEDARFASNSARVSDRAVVEGAINAVLATLGRDEWVALLGGSGIPCAPILDVAEAFAHPQVQATGIFQSAPGLDVKVVSAAWTLDGVRPPVRRPAPLLGEANEEVLGRKPPAAP